LTSIWKKYLKLFIHGFDLKLKEGNQAISDFRKLGPSSYLEANLMLFCVETGIKFINQCGDLGERFYSSIQTTYATALKLMKKKNILHAFAERAKKIIIDTGDIGYGLEDYLEEVYSDYYT